MLEQFPSLPTATCAYCGQGVDAEHAAECPLDRPIAAIGRIAALELAMRERGEQTGADIVDTIAQELVVYSGKPETEYGVAFPAIARHLPETIVRRERLQVLFAVLRANVPLRIRFDPGAHGGDPYPNAARLGADAEGIRIPLARGFSKVETGATQIVLGFDPMELRIQSLPEGEFTYYRQADRALARMVEGDVRLNDLRFLIVRLPKKYFPDNRMTELEREREALAHVMRLFTFGT